MVWARAVFHGLFGAVFHGLWLRMSRLLHGREGEGCGPHEVGARSAASPLTVGQAAGRSGRDPQHVALSSHTALTLSTFIRSVLVDGAQPGQLLQGMLHMLHADLS